MSFSWRDAPPTKDETRLGFFLERQRHPVGIKRHCTGQKHALSLHDRQIDAAEP
jgi:hypothetical protein